MKKRLVKIIKFFKAHTTFKYTVEVLLLGAVVAIFVFVLSHDITGGVLETILGFLLSTLFLYAFRIFVGRFEDVLKINYDVEDMLRIYRGGKHYRKRLTFNGTSTEFAYADTLINDNYRFEVVDDKNSVFEPDDFIMGNYETLFSAHTGSAKINGITIRLDKYELKDGVCTLYLGRSTFFNHLVTNRAMDFDLFEGLTLRQMYEYGPTISSIEDSKMSNHVGINALVFLGDGNLLIPRRKKDSTISKNKVTSSIAVKLNFPTDGRDEVDKHHFFYQNLIDNLSARTKIRPQDLSTEHIEVEFLGFGQNLYEGGKPQFYFAVYLKNIDSATYLRLPKIHDAWAKLDVDKCIYVADYRSFRFKKDRLSFLSVKKNGKVKKQTFECEMSYLCNLWHYEESRKLKESRQAERVAAAESAAV